MIEYSASLVLWRRVGVCHKAVGEHIRRGVTRSESLVKLLVPTTASEEILNELSHVGCETRNLLELPICASSIHNNALARICAR